MIDPNTKDEVCKFPTRTYCLLEKIQLTKIFLENIHSFYRLNVEFSDNVMRRKGQNGRKYFQISTEG